MPSDNEDTKLYLRGCLYGLLVWWMPKSWQQEVARWMDKRHAD